MTASLLNHLWQSTLFAACIATLVHVMRRNRAEVRHALWVAASVKFLLPFALLISLGQWLAPSPAPGPTSSVETSTSIAVAVDQVAQPFAELLADSAPVAQVSRAPIGWLPTTLVAVWAVGFALIGLLRFRGWLEVVSARRSSVPFHVDGGDNSVDIRSAPGLLGPGVVGWVRPVLLLPAGIDTQLTAAQLEAVIAHELCHVRRRDNLIAAVHMVVEALFWFHPIVWWIGARLVDERERACDEHVVSTLGEPLIYAEGILGVCKRYHESPVSFVSGVAGSHLKRRIADIIHERVGSQLTRGRRILIVVSAIAAIVLPFFAGIATAPLRASAQSGGDTRQFEVASVKPCEPQAVPPGGRSGGGNGSFSPGRAFLNCFVVKNLISMAHITHRANRSDDDPLDAWNGLRGLMGGGHGAQQVRGGPEWVYSDKYTIEAKAEGLDPTQIRGPDRGVMLGPMLRALLEDRFKLRVRLETEEAPMWALTVARSGLKPKPVGPDGCTMHDPATGRGPSMDEEIAMVRRGEKPICGHGIIGGRNGGNNALVLSGQQMSGVARALSMFTDRMIVDRTGIDAKFNLYLEFKGDEFAGDKLFFLQRDAEIAPPPTAPTLPVALREQWGLTLEPIKGPRGYLVIDRIERPTPNGPASISPTPGRTRDAGR